MKSILRLCLFLLLANFASAQQPDRLRIGIAGLTHTHVHGLLSKANSGEVEIVGIAEPDTALARRYFNQYKLPWSLLYPSLEEMLNKCKPEAVAAFNSIYGHLEVVKACAPRKIHVMVEKPLAVSLDHAKQMRALAVKHGIYLLTNYETTWYSSNHKAYELLDSIGSFRKLVVHDGHQGPKEIGVNKEFLNWLTDPVQNGGGAITDFGCYGANLLTWITKGERPLSVFAITQQIKPHIYPKVDDEATIVVTYPKAQGIIQASWNWPYSRKDMEIYGEHGYMFADRNGLKIRVTEKRKEEQVASSLEAPYNDPFSYFRAVVRGKVILKPTDLSSLENNMIVVEILEAAKKSAKEGKIVYLGGTENPPMNSGNADILWIQKIVDNWNYVCLNELHIEAKPLPWIIFYDSSYAWHLNADEKMLPSFEKTNDSVVFAGIHYQLIRITHQKDVWVPDREPIPVASVLISTMPYAQNKKAFFIAPLPSLFRKLAPPDQAPYLDFLYLGGNTHELTHTRQLPFVLPQLLKFHKTDKRKSLDDNTIEVEFSKNERFKQLFFEENKHLLKAVFTVNDDSCIAEIRQAFKLIQIRKREFFSGSNRGLGEADEIFLSLEGSAMWAQYRIMFKNTPNPDERGLLEWVVKQSPAWSQERGLILFLLIDRFSPNWKDRFFEKALPPATNYLRDVLDGRKK